MALSYTLRDLPILYPIHIRLLKSSKHKAIFRRLLDDIWLIMRKDLLTTEKVLEALKISKDTLTSYIKRGWIVPIKYDGALHKNFFTEKSLEKLKEQLEVLGKLKKD